MRIRYLLPYREHAIGDVVETDDFPVADILRQRGVVEFVKDDPPQSRRGKRREKAAHFTGADQ